MNFSVGSIFEVVVRDEDSGADVGKICFSQKFPMSAEFYSRCDFYGLSRDDFCIRFMFPGKATENDLWNSLRCTEKVLQCRISIDSVSEDVYALYVDSAKGDSRRSHVYVREICAVPELGDRFLRAEIFSKDRDGVLRWRAICDALPDYLEIKGDGVTDRLYYKFIQGRSKSLVVYFDYSKDVNKIYAYQEFIPRFNMKTDSSVLLLGNSFGVWGTATCFASDGRLIVADVLELIQRIVTKCGCQRVYLVGGSQGATAALVYGGLLPSVEHIYAAVPVCFDTKSMLRHLKEVLRFKDIHLAQSLMLAGLRGGTVSLYSSRGDPQSDWHADLSLLSSRCNFKMCDDFEIGHGEVLRYFIKDIYKSISDRECYFSLSSGVYS